MHSRITYCKDIYYFQVFLFVPAKGLTYVYQDDDYYNLPKTIEQYSALQFFFHCE